MDIGHRPPNARNDRACRALLLGSIVTLAAIFSFYNLGGRSISRADESLYARSTQEMLHGDSWVPTLHGTPFLHKPPLTQFVMSLSVSSFGETTWAYRLPSAAAGFAFLLLIPFFAYRLFQSRLVAVLSFAAILSCKVLFASHLIREAVPDGILLLFLLVGLTTGWDLWRELSSSREISRRAIALQILFGISVFMALLTKSVAGLASLLVWWLWMISCGRGCLAPLHRLVAILMLTTLIPVGAFIVTYLTLLSSVPGTFNAAIHYEVIEKLIGAGHNNTTVPHYYFSQLFIHDRAFPSLALGLALIFGIIQTCKGDKRCAYLSLSVLTPLIGYSVLHSRLYWYIAPVFASSAILIGHLLTSSLQLAGKRAAPLYSRILGGACFGVLAILSTGFMAKIIQGPLLAQKNTKLETAIRDILARKEREPNLRVVRLCINPHNERFQGLLLREWFYLDMLKPLSSPMCEDLDSQLALKAHESAVIISPTDSEKTLPKNLTITARSIVRLERWTASSQSNRVKEITFLSVQQQAP